ncbi:peptidase E [Asanoa sp. WMMD1127]|uniref:Type 1 glutamine amidotransferase-like domain-containing protein n=1 Tax=Asanoa sp. WMMD1127 TaxID=3016107 RepID=UPI0024168A37|nr:peptidase E [Asanoa sp. WMMD1127]MDG4822581.1 peptidase E [Asanoa sp. WMMD1127]
MITTVPRPPQIFAVSPTARPAGTPPGRRSALLDHAISLADVPKAKVCFVTTAVGDDPAAIASLYAVLAGADDAEASHLQLFPQPNVRDVRSFLLSRDLIWVSGGSVVNLLAVWRAHRLDEIMRECWEAGVVLGGGSAGSICWHVGGTTDSFSDDLDPVTDALAFLPYSNSVHHDATDQPRRVLFQRLVDDGTLPPGYATDDATGLHYVGTDLVEAVTAAPGADAYHVSPGVHRPLGARRIADRPI